MPRPLPRSKGGARNSVAAASAWSWPRCAHQVRSLRPLDEVRHDYQDAGNEAQVTARRSMHGLSNVRSLRFRLRSVPEHFMSIRKTCRESVAESFCAGVEEAKQVFVDRWRPLAWKVHHNQATPFERQLCDELWALISKIDEVDRVREKNKEWRQLQEVRFNAVHKERKSKRA